MITFVVVFITLNEHNGDYSKLKVEHCNPHCNKKEHMLACGGTCKGNFPTLGAKNLKTTVARFSYHN